MENKMAYINRADGPNLIITKSKKDIKEKQNT